MANRPCIECGTPSPRTRCPLHEADRNRERGSSAQRGYTNPWRRTRDAYIARHPLCEWSGCNELAIDVDHKTPVRAGGTHRHTNLQSLCRTHHARKTRDDRGRYPASSHPLPRGRA